MESRCMFSKKKRTIKNIILGCFMLGVVNCLILELAGIIV
jgi:hypothetical protein